MFFNYFVTVNDAAAPYRAIVFAIYETAKVDNLSLIYKFYLQFIVIITYSPSNCKRKRCNLYSMITRVTSVQSAQSVFAKKAKNAGKASIALPAFSYIMAPYGHQFSLNRCARKINPQHQPPSSSCE